MYYYYHRWYDPSIGRFISIDPRHGKLSTPESLNPYIYVKNNPVSGRDPSGEVTQEVPVGGAVIWWSDGGVTVLSNGSDVILAASHEAFRGVYAIQIDYSKYSSYDAKKITYSDNSVSVIPANRVILDLSAKAALNVRPVSIEDALLVPQLSTNTYPDRLAAYEQCQANAEQITLVAVGYLAGGAIASHVAVVFPPAEILVPAFYGAALIQGLAAVTYSVQNCLAPTPT